MHDNNESIQLYVKEAMQRDIGKKRARLGPSAMDILKVIPGDIIQMLPINKDTQGSSAIVWPADEDEKHSDTIRIDGQTRKNIDCSINDIIKVQKAGVGTAKAMTLTPVNESIVDDKDFTAFVHNRLKGLPLSEGDEIAVMILGNSMNFKVSDIEPKEIVKINGDTVLTLSTKSIDRKPRVTYEEVGGLRSEIKAMRDIVELPLRHPELFNRLGVEAHSGILLYGPPGCGKTLIARVLASESEANMYSINGPEIMNKYYGETEARLRDIFKEAKDNSPSIIFIDEIDVIAPKREEVYGDVEKRVVAQMLALMDGLTDRGNVIVLGATNRPDSVDPALRRPGRFDREFEISVPNEDGRYEVLLIHTRGMPIAKGVDLKNLSSELHGYTGADIKSLCREAAMKAIKRYLPRINLETKQIPTAVLQSMEIKLIDFYEAMHEVVPTAMREFYVERPKTWWKDVGGLDDIKKILNDNLLLGLKQPEKFTEMGIKPPRGALIYGPPGCGKTMIGQALATQSGANMIMVNGPEILSKWMGESEKAIREIFRKAKMSSPCVIIFDEIDSMIRARGRGSGSTDNDDGGNSHSTTTTDNILGQLLTEIEDGIASRIIVVGITSRPDLLDRSLLRTGRLDLVLNVMPPDEKARLEIIKILTKKMPIGPDVNLEEIAVSTKNYTGADLSALCREAAVNAMQNNAGNTITNADFVVGLKNVNPSITKDVIQWYTSIKQSISNAIPKPIDKTFYG